MAASQGYWLVKTEPDTYSWSDLEKDKKTVWDGVRNFEARNNLRSMKKGDLVFFYHTGDAKEIVGLAAVSKEAYPDPSAAGEDWSVVELVPQKRLGTVVTLAQIKKDKALAGFAMIRRSRLSVVPATKAEFERILELAKTRA
jgi:predicted RNA-binding protein with PUA-like domain